MCPWCRKKLVNRRTGDPVNKLKCPECGRKFWYNDELELCTLPYYSVGLNKMVDAAPIKIRRA